MEPTLQKDIDTPIVKVEKTIYPTATQQNLLNAWDSMVSVRNNWWSYYELERENRKKFGVFRIDFSDWSLIMNPLMDEDAPSRYSEIIQKIVDAIENKNYVIVCLSGDFSHLHKFKIALENELGNDVIIIDNPIQIHSKDNSLYPEKRIGIIKRQDAQDAEIIKAREAQ